MTAMLDGNELKAWFESRADHMVSVLGDLVAARSENPPGDCREVAGIVERELADMGARYGRVGPDPEHCSVIATVGKEDASPHGMVACHMDTVPAGEGWTVPPFELTRRGEALLGRGVCDNKGQLAASLEVLRFVAEGEGRFPGRFPGRISLAAMADEETGSALGAQWLLENGHARADYALVPDVPSEMKWIDIAEKGALWIEAEATGRQAHGSRPHRGANAIMAISRLLSLLDKFQPGVHHHETLGTPTMNPGVIEGGSAPNTVPATCRLQVDLRILPGTDKDKVLAELQSLADEAAGSVPGTAIAIREVMSLPPTEIAPDSPMVQHLMDAIETELAIKPVTAGMGGITVVKQFLAAGVPAVGYGPGGEEVPHMADEWITLTDLLGFGQVAARFFWTMQHGA